MSKTICLDFDGVIHSYHSGWQGITNIFDPPTSWCDHALRGLIEKGYELVVYSTRCRSWRGRRAIRRYLKKWGLPPLRVAKKKPPAFVTIDDRAITFDGNWATMIRCIESFEVWNKKEKGR